MISPENAYAKIKKLEKMIATLGKENERLKDLQIGQNLFNALYNLCDFTALESEQQIIIDAVKKDNEI